MTKPSNKEVRQWEYEHGERKLPEASPLVGNWSAVGLASRFMKRRRDRLEDAAKRMQEEQGE